MNNMINLIKMHYTSVLALKKSGAVMMGLAVFLIITNKSGSMLSFGAAFILVLLNYSTLAYEDKSKMNYLVYSLPVEPKEYILSKYIYGVINMGVSLLFADIMYIVLKNVNLITDDTIPLAAINLSIFIVGFIFVSITSPIALVVGFNKARLIIVFLCVLPICFSNTVAMVVPEISDSLINMSLERLEACSLIIGVVLTIISYIVCSRLYCKKDIN